MFAKEATLGTSQVKLHNPRRSGNVLSRTKEKIGDLQSGVYDDILPVKW